MEGTEKSESRGSARTPPLLPLTSEMLHKEKDDKLKADERDRQNRELKSGLHPLQHRFAFWYLRRQPGARSQASYEENMKKIVEFSTVEGFWVCYCHFARVSAMPNPTNLHLFKEGIRPLWEDPANRNGGKWIIRLKKTVSGRYWEELVLALVGDQLDYGDNVCGIVLSVRFGEDILSVWNRNASDSQVKAAEREEISTEEKEVSSIDEVTPTCSQEAEIGKAEVVNNDVAVVNNDAGVHPREPD
ncbi:hypothetical protein KI387_014728 [Taxus chinensis]|uniref:mRNA cap-binding protein n=1 Tax=Taxus chinensis TaxID=29808 RepID=A0AA38FI21_TAXCH|nr:hypothetical protein KI387_014728 [Taxus chinensis]